MNKKFNKHTITWFVNRVGKIIYRKDGINYFKAVLIDSHMHAKAIYNFHIYNKVSYEDYAG